MRMTILDASGANQTVTVKAPEAPTDKSGTITATGTAQDAMDANALRAGWVLQNTSASNALRVSVTGTATAASFKVAAGEFFGTAQVPLTTGRISVFGIAGDTFAALEW